MNAADIRKKFLDFFASHGHTVVPSSLLIPDDPSVLLTTAGMQQFKPYYTGKADPMEDFGSLNTASVQKSFRTSDIDEVGDDTHLTFFEMLGNFSFGGYYKKEAIQYAHEFITKVMGLPISYVTVFEGSQDVPRDEESRALWKSLGVDDVREEGMEDVFWGPTGSSGPCGPTTEIYCKNAQGNDVEVWNIVFNEYVSSVSREELLAGKNANMLTKLEKPGVDTGMGLERLAMVAQKKQTIFKTDLFTPILANLPPNVPPREQRVIADHLRGIAFLLADGVRPSNKEAGYVVRRLMRRVLAYEYIHGIPVHVCGSIMHEVIHEYGSFYPELTREGRAIREAFDRERERFSKTLARGVKEVQREKDTIDGKRAFDLYQSYGLPFEITQELSGKKLDREAFEEEREKHTRISGAGQEKKFGGHGLILNTGELKASTSEEVKVVTRLHTATHLLHQALRTVLGSHVKQMGSDITPERTRFDFSHPAKMTAEEIQHVEELVNETIKRDLPVECKEMSKEEAEQSGALSFFKEKYPQRVTVYSIGDFSKEFCGGPHVARTSEIGTFKIVKEESSSAGVRRIRAIVE